MSYKQDIDQLWRELRTAIDKTYASRPDPDNDHDADCLRDYVENRGWSDSLASLLGRESAAERQHRRGHSAIAGFSIETAAKLLIMNQVAQGSQLVDMPKATAFLVFRRTAVEAQVIGYLIREHLMHSWVAEVDSLDYAKLMAA
jgi:hypothetical protein